MSKHKEISFECLSYQEMMYRYSIEYEDEYQLIGYRLKKICEGKEIATLTLCCKGKKKNG